MQAMAKMRHAKLSAQKARLIANQIRGLPAEQALNQLRFSTEKAAGLFATHPPLELRMRRLRNLGGE